MKRLHILMPDPLHYTLRSHADNCNTSASELVRRALITYLEDEGVDVTVPMVKWGGVRGSAISVQTNSFKQSAISKVQ